MENTLISRAKAFATHHHGAIQQKHKYTGEDYIVHPIEVSEIVALVTNDDAMIAAALLHDVVEDTPVNIEDIEREFGAEVSELVSGLTDVSTLADGSRKVRKEIDRQHTAKAGVRVHTIKLADLISNSRSIIRHDPVFAKVYIAEKKLLLEVLAGGNADLFLHATNIVKSYEEFNK